MKVHFILFFLFSFMMAQLMAQEPCYMIIKQQGIDSYNAGDFNKAKEYFEAAKYCDDKPDDKELNEWLNKCNITLNVTPLNLSFESVSDGIVEIVKVRTKAKWDCKEYPQWCKIKKSRDTLYVSCTNNNSTEIRTGTIIIVAASKSYSLKITQKPMEIELRLEPPSLIFDRKESTKSVKIKTNARDWSCDNVPDWCIAYREDDILKVKCDSNNTTISRTGRILILSGEKKAYIDINQEAGDVTLDVDSSSLLFEPDQETKTVNVATNAMSWQCETDNEWIILNKTDNHLYVSCKENVDTFNRKGKVIIYVGTKEAIINIYQTSGNITLKATPLEIKFSYKGGRDTVFIETNKKKWNFKSSIDWFCCEKVGEELMIICERNNGKEVRFGSLVITTETKSLIITVSQDSEDVNSSVIKITSNPTEQKLYIDGDYAGQTPVELQRDFNMHTVSMGLEDRYYIFNKQTDNISFEQGRRFSMLTASSQSRFGMLSGFVNSKSFGAYNHFQMRLPSCDIDESVTEESNYSITAGPVFEINQWLSAFGGVGVGLFTKNDKLLFEMELELGAMTNYKCFTLSAGINFFGIGSSEMNTALMAGFGVNMKRFYDAKYKYCASDSRLWCSLSYIGNQEINAHGLMIGDIGESKVRGYLKLMYSQTKDTISRGSFTAGIVFTPVSSCIDFCVGGGYGLKLTGEKSVNNSIEAEFGIIINIWRFPISVFLHGFELNEDNRFVAIDFGLGFSLGRFKVNTYK